MSRASWGKWRDSRVRKNLHFVIIILKIESGKNHQWMLILGEVLMLKYLSTGFLKVASVRGRTNSIMG